jgi:hypothetical protein
MQRALVEVHLVVGLGLLAVVAAVVVIAALRGHGQSPLLARLQRAVAALIVAQVFLGAVLFAVGKRPQTNLHLVYALAAILVMPVARSMARRSRSTALLYQVGGPVLLLGVIFRLATTG